MNKKLFPIGTVLSVEGVPTRVMVIGHLQQQKNSEKISGKDRSGFYAETAGRDEHGV